MLSACCLHVVCMLSASLTCMGMGQLSALSGSHFQSCVPCKWPVYTVWPERDSSLLRHIRTSQAHLLPSHKTSYNLQTARRDQPKTQMAAWRRSSAAAAAQTSSAAAAEKLTPNRPPGWLCACKSVTTRGRPRHVAACVVVAMEKQLVHVGAEVCMLASALPTWGKWRAVVVQPSKVVWQPVNGEGGDPQKSEVVVERRSTK